MSDESDELDEFWALYAEEGDQALNTVEEALLLLRGQPDDAATVARLFRAMHTFKGGARSMGLTVTEALAHVAEDLIGLVRDEGVQPDESLLALLLRALDALRGMLEWSVSSRGDADPATNEALLEQMRQWRDQAARGEQPPAVTVAPAVEEEADDLFAGWPEAGSPAEPAAAEEPEDDGTVEAIVFEPVAPEFLADDPVYREIFAGMAQEALQAMAEALAAAPPAIQQADEAAERLQHAAEQLGMAQWQTALQLLRSHAAAADLAAAVGELEALYRRDFAAPAGNDSAAEGGEGQRFATRAADTLQTLVLAAELARGDTESALEAADLALAALLELTRAAGYVSFQAMLEQCRERLAEPGFSWESQFPSLLCQLYEELAAVQELAALEGETFPLNAKAQLRAYCAERVFENLLLLDKLAGDWRGGDASRRCDELRGLLKQIHHACGHYGLESAAQLCMALIELFFQVESGGMAADALLLRIVRSFGADMAVVMNAIAAGEEPDTAAIEKLLLDASGVMLESSGTVSSASIEARLGLPKSFHKVLTPESVATALECLENGWRFYIVRADLNRDEALAEAFLEWMLSGAAKVVSNVTVMAEHHTLFDFLLATPLPASALTEALAALDASGELLAVQMALADRKADEPAESAAPAAGETAGVPGKELPAEVMDSLGELVTAQAMLQHAIGSLAQADVLRQVGKLLAAEPVDKAAIAGLLEGWQERLEHLQHLEQHSASLLQQLQEQALAARLRPAALLLKPLQPWLEAAGQCYGVAIAGCECEGGEIALDQGLLDALKSPLRRLLDCCVEACHGGAGPYAAKVRLEKSNDHVHAVVQYGGNGASAPGLAVLAAGDNPALQQIRADLRQLGGDLRWEARDGGAGFSLDLPLAMVVLDGMVVRSKQIHYVVPLEAIHRIVEQSDGRLLSVAESGASMLRLEDALIPIQRLHGDEPGAEPDSGGKSQRRLFVVVEDPRRRKIALAVDDLAGQQQVLIRPLQGYLSGIRGVSGCALLGNGDVGLVVDLNGLSSG